MQSKYKRVLLKISGEALAGDAGFGLDQDTVFAVCKKVAELAKMGTEVAIVVGGGNFWRGRTGEKMDRVRADHMGMLATSINALALADALEQQGAATRVMSAVEMRQFAEPFIKGRAVRHLEKGRIVVFACGTGNPFFSTDTAAALRAAEIGAEIILLAKRVDAVYDSDPEKNPNAVRFDAISFSEVLARNLGVMDATATSLCMENNIPIHVFGLHDPENIIRAVSGEKIGTLVSK